MNVVKGSVRFDFWNKFSNERPSNEDKKSSIEG